jgi:hypothetical protein
MKELMLRRRAVDWREVNGEMIGLDAERSTYLAANPSGTLLWRALAAGATKGRLADLLVETYEIDPDTARRDVAAFLTALRQQGLLEKA